MIEDLFKKNNLKVTKQRKEVISVITDLKEEATLKNIINNINSDMDKSTIYRILSCLIKHNIIIKQINFNNEDYYLLKTNHTHFIKCIKCQKIENLDNCPFDMSSINGFKIINHNVSLDGICSNCQKV